LLITDIVPKKTPYLADASQKWLLCQRPVNIVI
jgi:hypothetical protein